MPSATAKPAPKATLTETITRTEKRDPVEIAVSASAPAPEPREDFWKYIARLTDDDWKEHKVTLYRYPLGQTKPDKLGRYVKTYKYGNPLVSEDQVYEEFGGSQYTAMLTGPKDGEKSVLLARHSWEMDGPARNPWAQSAGAPGVVTPQNSELAQTLQVVLEKLNVAQRSPSIAADPAVKESISLIQQLTSAIKPQGVGELVGALADLQKLTGVGTGGGGNSIRETIVLLKELGIIGGERKSLASEIKEILEIAGMMNGGGGGGEGGGGRRQDWPTTLVQNLPSILEKVTPIADKFADAAKANARTAEIRANVTAGRPALPAPSRPTTQPATQTPASPAAASVPAAESPGSRTVAAPETEPATEQPSSINVAPPTLDWVKAKAVQMYQRGATGDAIAEFLDTLDDQLGGFLSTMNEEAFAKFVEGDPILRQIVGTRGYKHFLADFVGYFAEEEEPPGAPASDGESNVDKK